MRSATLALIGLTGIVPGIGWSAQDVEVRGGTVEIQADQRSAPGDWLTANAGAQPASIGSLGEDLTILLEPERKARIVVAKPLSVLFTYSLEAKDPVPTASFTAAIEFLKGIQSFGSGPAGAKGAAAALVMGAGGGCPATYAGVNLCVLQISAASLLDFRSEARKALSNAMSADADAIQRSKESLRALAEQFEQLEKDVASINEEDLRASVGAPGKTPLAQALKNSGTTEAPLFQTALALNLNRTEISAASQLARQFVADYQDSFVKLPLGKTISYDAGHEQPFTLVVAANRKYADFFPAGTDKYQNARAGSFALRVAPKERLALSLGAGVLYSFVRDPEFSVSENSSGALTIAKKENDYAEFNGAVVLNVTGAKWRLFGAHPFVQVGLAPSSENLAVLAGVGLQLFDRGAVSLGAIYQRVDTLAGGLAEGQIVESVDALKTEKEFKTGLYLMLSVTTK